jgi:putative MFS transporter
MAIVFANAATDLQLLIAGCIMIFFIQVAGNSMQIFASEVFPTNARASGFGWAAGVGRLATAGIIPAILWIQTGWGLTAVFVCLAVGHSTRPRIQAPRARRGGPTDGLN